MSRVIVKNLPKNTTEASLRSIFEQKGLITDLQLKFTKEGKFRQFAFVGYKNEHEGEEAIKAFHNTYIKTTKIQVESCAALGDSKKPKSWSKYAPDSSKFKQINKSSKLESEDSEEKLEKKKKTKKKDQVSEILDKYKEDPLFEEYLSLHAPKEAEKLHKPIQKEEEGDDNDDQSEESASDSGKEEEDGSENLANQNISDLEYMKKLINKKSTGKPKKEPRKLELFTVKLRGLPYKCKKKAVKDFFKPLKAFTIRIARNIHGIAYVGFKNERDLKKALLKDRSFLSGKRIAVAKYESSQENNKNEEPKHLKWKNQEESLKNEEDIAESGKIFIRNLAYSTTEEEINDLFVKHGPLAEVNLPRDSQTQVIKGFGTVTFVLPENAISAYKELDGTFFNGRMLHLLPGKSNDTPDKGPEIFDTDYKKRKLQKQKAEAHSSHNWNSLFLGHDAVANVIAANSGISKENLLAVKNKGSAAVTLALGETGIIAETRKYLEKEGVILDSFSAANVKRSNRILLIKNLPAQTEMKEIRKLCSKYGELSRVILPPSGVTAVVEFVNSSDAKKAYTHLAYSKFKYALLYLEWAPENSLRDGKDSHENNTENNTEETVEVEKEEKEPEEVQGDPEENTTVFVKNLHFRTTDQKLKEHFSSCGKIFSATVATKKDPSDPQNRLSMGYGFVQYYKKSCADTALKTLQQSLLDNKSLELKRSDKTFVDEVKTTRKVTKKTKQTGTKILVRNVPFQAKTKEIIELFQAFGELKSVRMPKKMAVDSDVQSHRGFAFVDYVTENDASTAFEALSQSTHLYGRRLVLEWANKEETVEDIRKRTADHFNSELKSSKKSKKSVAVFE